MAIEYFSLFVLFYDRHKTLTQKQILWCQWLLRIFEDHCVVLYIFSMSPKKFIFSNLQPDCTYCISWLPLNMRAQNFCGSHPSNAKVWTVFSTADSEYLPHSIQWTCVYVQGLTCSTYSFRKYLLSFFFLHKLTSISRQNWCSEEIPSSQNSHKEASFASVVVKTLLWTYESQLE